MVNAEGLIAQDVAILAPVPRPILLSAEEDAKPRVAFGSEKYEFWERLPNERYRVLIYESFRDDPLLAVSWDANFEFWSDSTVASKDPELRDARPSASWNDWAGFVQEEWSIWWFCTSLRRLDEPIPLKALRTTRGKPFSSAYIPRGPELIEAP